jgi:5-methylcytosine-specific restriction protein A
MIDRLGATMKNQQWSWSAIDDENKKAYFCAWSHYKEKRNGEFWHLFMSDEWAGSNHDHTKPGYTEAKEYLSKVINEGYKAYLIMIEPTERFTMPSATPDQDVKIKKVLTSFVIEIQPEKIGPHYWGKPIKRVEL